MEVSARAPCPRLRAGSSDGALGPRFAPVLAQTLLPLPSRYLRGGALQPLPPPSPAEGPLLCASCGLAATIVLRAARRSCRRPRCRNSWVARGPRALLRIARHSSGGACSAAGDAEEEAEWHDLRFRGVGLLFGAEAVDKLRQSTAAVIGLGGVGSWVAEALARSGLGGLTLVDLDDVCISNTNRQLHAMTPTVGRTKVDVLAERVRLINPACRVDAVHDFFVEETEDRILDARPLHVVVDAIDSVSEKARMVSSCQRRGIPIVVSGGLGGKSEPTMFREADITRAEGDGLLRRVRDTLRRSYNYPPGDGYPPKKSWSVPCVFSPENRQAPVVPASQDGAAPTRRTCDTVFGTFCPAAGALGCSLAAAAVRVLLSTGDAGRPPPGHEAMRPG